MDAVKRVREAAEPGMADAQYRLGEMYDYGRGVTKNITEALQWYRKAAEQGDADALYRLGWMYLNGRGVPQSDREALKWYQLAAEHGHANAAEEQRRLEKKTQPEKKFKFRFWE